MQKLNFPEYAFRFKNTENKVAIFDEIRKKFIILTPEEWVRQHFVAFLCNQLKYPAAMMALEKGFKLNGRAKRADLVVHDRAGAPWMVVECKASHIQLNESAFYQAAAYHQKLNIRFLVVTNGMKHYCCSFENETFNFIEGFPEYNS